MKTSLSSRAHEAFIHFCQQGIYAVQAEGIGLSFTSFIFTSSDLERCSREIEGVLENCGLRMASLDVSGAMAVLSVTSQPIN